MSRADRTMTLATLRTFSPGPGCQLPDPRVWEPAANQWSVTDRLILLANRVAEPVGKKSPDLRTLF